MELYNREEINEVTVEFILAILRKKTSPDKIDLYIDDTFYISYNRNDRSKRIWNSYSKS